VQESATGAASSIDDFFSQFLNAVIVVRLCIRNEVDQSRPATADTQDSVAFSQCTHGYCTDGRVKTRDVSTTSQDADCAFIFCHDKSSEKVPLICS
jgi:hypothetical protein